MSASTGLVLQNESGMGLLEVMVAGAIMTITVLTMFGSMNYMARSQKGMSQITALDSIAGGISRVLNDPVRCRDAFKEALGSANRLVVPEIPWSAAPQTVNIPEISVGSGAGAQILAKPGLAQGGLNISLLRFVNPVAGQPQQACPEGTCNVYPATLFMEGQFQTTDGTLGAKSKRYRWAVTIVANSVAPFRVSSCSGTGGAGGGTVTGTGTIGRVPRWSNASGGLEDTAILQANPATTGNVGIVNTAPAQLLDLGNFTRTADTMVRVATGNGVQARNWDLGVTYGNTELNGINYAFKIDDPNRAGTDFLIRWDTGNVGLGWPVGLTNPQHTLDLGTPNFGLQAGAAPDAGFLRFGDNTGWKFHIGRSQEAAAGAYNTGATGVLLTVQDNGLVGIGIPAPTQRLHVNGNIKMVGSRTTLFTEGDIPATHTGGVQFLTWNNGLNNVWTPTDPAGTPLNSAITFGGNGSFNSNIVDVNVTGTLTAAVYGPSDLGLKKDVEPLEDSLEKILNLRGVSFSWRKEKMIGRKVREGRDIGVIAQEIEREFPEAVETSYDGIKTVAHGKLVAPLIEAVRALFRMISDHDQELANLRDENAKLKERVERLEANSRAPG